MEKEKRTNKFPDGFFSKKRNETTIKEAVKDIIPVEWKKTKHQQKRNTTLSKAKDLSLN